MNNRKQNKRRTLLMSASLWTAIAIIFAPMESTRVIGTIGFFVAIGLWVAVWKGQSSTTHGAQNSSPPQAQARSLLTKSQSQHTSDSPPDYTPTPLAELPAYELSGDSGYPNVDVEGEFARIPAIHAAIGAKPKLDQEIERTDLLAQLRPEPENPYDANAVAVIIKGNHVGYLPRETAAEYQPVLARIVEAGYAPTIQARIWAVARRTYDDSRSLKYHANVRVSMGPAHLVAPLNDPTPAPYSLIPWGSALQVAGEEHHQDVLAEYESAEGDGIIFGSMHVVEGGSRNAPKNVIEVRVDGNRIGKLTPASSQHFIPTVKHLEVQGLTAAVWLRVKGNLIAKQVTVQATKAHELPSDWFATPVTVPRLHGTAKTSRSDGRLDDEEIRNLRPDPMWDDA